MEKLNEKKNHEQWKCRRKGRKKQRNLKRPLSNFSNIIATLILLSFYASDTSEFRITKSLSICVHSFPMSFTCQKTGSHAVPSVSFHSSAKNDDNLFSQRKSFFHQSLGDTCRINTHLRSSEVESLPVVLNDTSSNEIASSSSSLSPSAINNGFKTHLYSSEVQSSSAVLNDASSNEIASSSSSSLSPSVITNGIVAAATTASTLPRNGNDEGNAEFDLETAAFSTAASTLPVVPDIPRPTENGGYSHTVESKAKISAANKGKTPWNKGKTRSEETKRRIAEGVRKRNRLTFLKKVEDLGLTEEEYYEQQRVEKEKKDADKLARKTAKGGYRLTDATKKKISKVLKEKFAKGELKPPMSNPNRVSRKGFKHTPETKEKISAALRERWANDAEYRSNMLNKTSTNNSSESVRKRIAETLRQKWKEPVFRAEMMEKMKNRKKSPVRNAEHRARISESMKKRWQDKGYRQRAVVAMAKYQEEAAKTRPPKPIKPKKVRVKKAREPSKRPRGRPKLDKDFVGVVRMVQPLDPNAPRRQKVKGTRKSRAKKEKAPTGVAVQQIKPKINIRQPSSSNAISNSENVVNGSADDVAFTNEGTALTVLVDDGIDGPIKKKKMGKNEGSVDKLREERRDLYDLLYGEEDGRDSLIGETGLCDENLDEFDPYGLEDF